MSRSYNKSNNSFMLLLGLVAVFFLSIYVLNNGASFNTGVNAGFFRKYPKVTLPPEYQKYKATPSTDDYNFPIEPTDKSGVKLPPPRY